VDLNSYRREVFEKNRTQIKPVVLFEAQPIASIAVKENKKGLFKNVGEIGAQFSVPDQR
jgi:hypothetical protein